MLNSFKDFYHNFLESSTDRIKNPFFGAYLFSFIAYNWRPILFLFFSNDKIENKIIIINAEYANYLAIIYPLIIALTYILIVPYINLLIDLLLRFSNKKKESRKNENIINNLKQKKEEAKHEREIANERAGTNEIETLNSKINALEKENDIKSQELIDTINRNNEEVTNLNFRIDDLSAALKSKIEEYDKLNNSIDNVLQILELLTDQESVSDRKIKSFLKNYLTLNEIKNLRNINVFGEKDIYHNITKSFRKDIVSLLLKAEIFTKRQIGMYVLTEQGSKFIEEL